MVRANTLLLVCVVFVHGSGSLETWNCRLLTRLVVRVILCGVMTESIVPLGSKVAMANEE